MDKKIKIKNVKIIPGCVSCGSCEVIAPEVFEVKKIATIKTDACIQGNEEKILEAAEMCPVSAIEIERE